MEEATLDTLIQFFKAVANVERLKILGLLANDRATLPELAATLGLRDQAVSRHLSQLTHLGLVVEEPAEPGPRYALDAKAVERMSRELLAPLKQAEQALQAVGDANADETKVLRSFFKGDRLQSVPASPAKRRVVLAWLADRFELERRYSEAEVNEILKQHFDDHAALRRYLVDDGFLARERSIYWRVPAAAL